MVKITRVYTGGGDKGESSLVDGSRRMKSDLRFEVVGVCDELNSLIGTVLMEINRLPSHEDGGDSTNVQRVQKVVGEAFGRIQNELFDLGAELACPPENLPEYMVLLSETQADLLVEEMDVWLEDLEPLSSFILPTGPAPVAMMHLARTVVRRLERSMVRLLDHEGEGAVRALTLVYINRFSDWLFILGRWVSLQLNHDESLWVPLGKRPAEQGVAGRVRMMRSNDDDFTDL
ncbi:cob(I)yrinic acid a,c-diamide adenosyltransferase [bacterium]|nr:cob(I)yrinic acid a,c-diamide adenosyltransferase [bacterium]